MALLRYLNAAGWARVAGFVLSAQLSSGCVRTPATSAQSGTDLSAEPPATFELEGKPFCFAGSSAYYPIYKSRAAVDDLFDAARALNLKVMRVWGMLDRGSLDGSVPNADGKGEKQGVYFQYWDNAAKRPRYNDGESGLGRLDYVLAAAAKRDLKLIIVLTNNWREFGGMDQYLLWYGRDKHHEFYSAPEVKQAYRDWAQHLVTRTSTLTGLAYRDDPTILGWELANEPRCRNGTSFDSDSGWDSRTLTSWADEMSAYVKSLDPNHLVSVGDEGFLNAGSERWGYGANDGVDHGALTALPEVDFGTFHLYPESWGMSPQAAEQWIVDHVRVARGLGKPSVLEEFGLRVARTPNQRGEVSHGLAVRQAAYARWNDLLLERGGSASLAWLLSGSDDDGRRYPDYDGFAFYRDDATGGLLARYAERFADAPACQAQAQARARAPAPSSSPFVRVRAGSPVGWP